MENSLKMKVELVREERRRRVEEWERWHTETENMDNNKQQKSSKKVTITMTEEEEQKYIDARKVSKDSVQKEELNQKESNDAGALK